MRRTLSVAVGILIILFITNFSYAQDKNIYVSLGIGFSIPQTQTDQFSETAEFNSGLVTKGSLGYTFTGSSPVVLRSELEISYRRYEADRLGDTPFGPYHGADGNLTYLTGMVNGLLDFKTGTRVTPFVGIGIGMSRVSYNSVKSKDGILATIDDTDNVFAYQGMAGLAYDITESWKIDLEYRYFHTQDTTLKNDSGVDGNLDCNSNHSVIVGVRYLF
jgi:OOP family OmpA-OmpF porin